MARVVARRDRKKEARWRWVVAGQRGSGMSIRAYCLRHGVKMPAFFWWQRELARRDAAQPRAAFAPVQVVADTPAVIEIALPCGRQVRVRGQVDKQSLADVLAVLVTVETQPC